MQLLEFLVVGVAAGWILGKIRRGRGYGLVVNLLIGALGSLIGWFLMGFLRVETPNLFTQLAMAVVGAIVFFFVVSLFKRKRHKKSEEDEDE
jgi:uncharacterized membrane protein YeaQ/YmgE (transglycosylase-associated protein family)